MSTSQKHTHPHTPGLWATARNAAVAGHLAARRALATEDRRTGYSATMDGHIGSPHQPVDVVAQRAVERYLYTHADLDFLVVGEEVMRSMWVPVGGLLVTVDPVDGTAPATDLGFGWSTVVLVHRLARPNTWRLVGASVCDSSLHVTSYVKPGVVVVGDALQPVEDDRAVTGPLPAQTAIAAVGAKPAVRSAWATSNRDLDRISYNLGGTPSAWGLLAGRLGASVMANASTQWDATHVFLASQAGRHVAIADGLVDRAGVARWFETPALPGQPTGPVVVPPCVVAVNADDAVTLADHYALRAPARQETPVEVVR